MNSLQDTTNLEICKLLLEAGADVHVENDAALRSAAHKGHLEVCKLLLENGANIHAIKDSILYLAAQENHLEVCKLLLKNGADLTILFTKDGDPQEIVHKFATKEQIEEARNLIHIEQVIKS